MNTPQEPPSAEQLLAKIGRYVEQCYWDLDAGKQVDLSGMDEEVGVLCEQVALLPVEEAERLQPKMQELMARLTDLGKKLEETRREVQRQLENLNLQQKAQKAYASTPGQPPSSPKSEGGSDDNNHN